MKILSEVLKLYGLAEVAGPKSNPVLLKILNNHAKVNDDGGIAWCGLLMGEVFSRLGLERPKSYLAARSWLNVGESIDLKEASVSEAHTDLVIFWRNSPNAWQGHVGVYVGQNSTHIFVAGGNQGDAVNITAYLKSRLLGVRRVYEQ